MSADILRLMILIAVFAAVLLGVEVVISSIRASRGAAGAINKRLALISRGFSRDEVMINLRRPTAVTDVRLPPLLAGINYRLDKMLAGAGLKVSASRIVLMLVIAAIAIFWVLIWLIYMNGITLTSGRLLLIASLAVAIGLGLPLMVLSRLAGRRRKQLVEQFPIALDVFVRGLRAGHPVASALELVTTEMADPIGSEFGLVLDEVTYGAELRDALQNMADRCGVDDMQMFVVSLSIQAETGGNLAEILENLAGVIRERASMMMKVRALSSEGRMTAFILTALPVVSFVGLFIASPSFYLDVADDPAFIPGFATLLVGFGIGVMWIRKLIDLKV
jgi:tight adherence protein B